MMRSTKVLSALFQSAPLTEARGDRPVEGERAESSTFQSAPLTEARGDIPEVGPIGGLVVSIRASDRSQRRLRCQAREQLTTRSFNPRL